MKLAEYIKNNLNELEKNHDYQIGTETVRSWIDIFNHEKKPKVTNHELKKLTEKFTDGLD
jgi:uncharacterized protein YbcC (UPF0753/DUF2309 family)